MENETCKWTQEDEGSHYSSDCGMHFIFEEDGPTENGFKFCPKCGKPLVAVEWEQETTEANSNE